MPLPLHSKNSPAFITLARKTISAAVASVFIASSAAAVGLGKLTILSALGQPLRAEIELTAVTKDEAGSIAARLASAEAFTQAGIDFNPALFTLRFAIEQRGGRQFILVTSPQPINEPFMDMLLELNGNGNKLVREYTFLLDPPDLKTASAAQVNAVPKTVNVPSRMPTAVRPIEGEQKPLIPEKPANSGSAATSGKAFPPPAAEAKSGDYHVKRGDSLAKIAGQYRKQGVSLDQMLVALYRANQSAFVSNNMNRLRSGQILTVPTAEEARAVANPEAHSIVITQAGDFNEYRNRLAGHVAGKPVRKSAEARQSSGGKITAKVEEQPNPANDAKDKLKLSKAGAAVKSVREGKGTAGVSQEELLAKDKAIA